MLYTVIDLESVFFLGIVFFVYDVYVRSFYFPALKLFIIFNDFSWQTFLFFLVVFHISSKSKYELIIESEELLGGPHSPD